MTDIFTKRKRSEVMSLVHSKNTVPEKIIRKELRREGYANRSQYGKHRIDVAFPSLHVAVFVDGCFWHKCPKHFKMPKSNVAFWKKKINGNAKRDARETRALKNEGWKVIRVWEHDLRRHPWKVLLRVRKALEGRKRFKAE